MEKGHSCLASTRRLRPSHKTRGFSMLELTVTVGIVLILSAITVPALIPAYENYRLSWQATALSSLIQQARYTAVKRNTTIGINVAALGGQKAVYVDLNGNGALDASEPMVLLPSDVTLLPAGTAPGPASTGYAAAVTPGWPINFNSRGTVSSGGAATIYILYLGNPNRPDWGFRAVTVTPMGQVKPWGAANNGTWHNL
jgi:prepilin-type N-terminal cleavage/methylation domain-containing protein